MSDKEIKEEDLQINNSIQAKAGKYLTFVLDQEIYGLEILKVQEIIGIMKVTKVPKTPSFIRGVINLRGQVLPVFDLRLKFGLEGCDDTEKTCVIVMQILFNNNSIIMGIIVDEVSEVLDIKDGEIEEPPSFGSTINIDFIMGMGKVGDKVIMLLDVDKVLNTEELSILKGV